jgi:hypothetical protein
MDTPVLCQPVIAQKALPILRLWITARPLPGSPLPPELAIAAQAEYRCLAAGYGSN